MDYDAQAVKEISQGIITVFNENKDSLPYDKTIEGRIIASLGNNSYTVLINGQTYSMSSYGTTTFAINDIVNILYPQNKIDKAYIIPKGGSSGGGGTNTGDMLKSVYDTNGDGIVDNANYANISTNSSHADEASFASHSDTTNSAGECTGNSDTATKLATARTISLSGDVTGFASFDGSANASITATVVDDSHNHIISNIDGLQTALNSKANTLAIPTFLPANGGNADTVDGYHAIVGVTDSWGTIPVINADGVMEVGKYFDFHVSDNSTVDYDVRLTADTSGLTCSGSMTAAAFNGNASSATKLTTAKTISLIGDVTGSTSFNGSANSSITATIVDDSHNHIISNIDGLQDILDSKVDDSQVLTNVPVNAKFTDTIYTLPISSNTILGGIKVGANLTIGTEGTLNANDNPSSFILKQENFIATAGQTVFTLTKGTYLPNSNRMFWYWNFVKQENSTLNEASSTTVTFPDGMIDAGDEILLEYIEVINSHPYPIHATEHLTGGLDPILVATQITDGLMLATDKLKLDSIEQGALANKIEVVQQNGTALTITDKTVNVIVPTKTSDITNDNNFITASASITGNSATATKLSTARTISLTGDVTGSVSFDGSANKSITATVADDSHNHVISNVDGLQTVLDTKVDNSRINDNGTTTELWTASKIQSEITSNLPTDVLQYNGTISIAPTTITMDIPTMTDYKSNGIEVLLLRGERWDRAIHGVDYVYGFISETQLEIEFLNTGTYKVNYAFVSTGNISFTIMSDTQPTDQNTNDFWYEILG